MAKIYCVEDDTSIREIEIYTLNTTGFEAVGFENGKDFFETLHKQIPDLILLDIMLPDISGMDILTSLKKDPKTKDIPVILASAKGTEFDKISGLDTGADDYLTKPFDAGELLARLRALLRRPGELALGVGAAFGDLSLRQDSRSLLCRDRSVKLGQKEYHLMEVLMLHKGNIVHKDLLAEKVWGVEDASEYNNVEVYISFLRKKLAYLCSRVQIRAARGVGYSLETGEEAK